MFTTHQLDEFQLDTCTAPMRSTSCVLYFLCRTCMCMALQNPTSQTRPGRSLCAAAYAAVRGAFGALIVHQDFTLGVGLL